MNSYHTRGNPPSNAAGDKRTGRRERYRYRQTIAPIQNGRSPAPQQFFEVVCGDISAGGFSFYLGYRPQFEQLVVALGLPSDLTHLTARVVNVRELHRKSGTLYRVGCRFTERVRL